MDLRQTFYALAGRYTPVIKDIEGCWQEITLAYTHEKRHYHNLAHLENLLIELIEVKYLVSNWDTILFTLFYHDIVYDVRKNNNEEKSAELAAERLKQMNVPPNQVMFCQEQIMATQSHALSPDKDTNLFTDADLSILGKEWSVYEQYIGQVRKEYSIYPNFLYKPGRRKVLQYFLGMERIFKTDYFFKKYETRARENLGREIDLLA